MKYSVTELAKIAGVSVRTLHYYDEIGLLKPAFVETNTYRYYEEKELLKLQQILFFRELEFPLEKIKQLMQSPEFDSLNALIDQKNLLLIKKERIEKLLVTITKTIDVQKGGDHMSTDDTFSAFNDPTYQQHKDEVEKRWSHTDAYKQSQERVSRLSKADLKRIKKEAEDITETTATLMKQGMRVTSPEVQKQVDRFYKHLSHFYDPTYELFKGLGQMYITDPRFTATYEKRGVGFAQFMCNAMLFYADTQIKK